MAHFLYTHEKNYLHLLDNFFLHPMHLYTLFVPPINEDAHPTQHQEHQVSIFFFSLILNNAGSKVSSTAPSGAFSGHVIVPPP